MNVLVSVALGEAGGCMSFAGGIVVLYNACENVKVRRWKEGYRNKGIKIGRKETK